MKAVFYKWCGLVLSIPVSIASVLPRQNSGKKYASSRHISIEAMAALTQGIPFLNWARRDQDERQAGVSLLPMPKHITTTSDDFFVLRDSVTIRFSDAISEDSLAVSILSDLILNAPPAQENLSSSISLEINSTLDASYRISVNKAHIQLMASDACGLFYGVQTLKQLLKKPFMKVQSMTLVDDPVYKHRGIHLDVSRHFFPAADIKKMLNTISTFKFNRFHWHITDDQGWRLPVAKYPQLTAFYEAYTEEEIRDIVQYAADRYIEVIPEVDVPGHAAAAIAAYPEIGNIGFEAPRGPIVTWGMFPWTLSPTQASFDFLEAVLDTLVDLFPSKVIHVGGDEAPTSQWDGSTEAAAEHWVLPPNFSGDVQGFFNQYLGKALHARGRRLAGWDETQSHEGLAADAIVYAWRSSAELDKAVMSGRSAVCCDNGFTYFDYIQGWSEPEGQPVIVTLQTVYERCAEFAQHWEGEPLVLGAQGQLWSEYIQTLDHLEYMAFPRSLALADCLWSGGRAGTYQDFIERLEPQLKVLEENGVNFRRL